ncbi:MAG: DUF2807 domain-containing protein [Marinilabiliaceae bacterium]|nr:DUF2807 domain-containing protein [Marinilabiliaceae bacterium]
MKSIKTILILATLLMFADISAQKNEMHDVRQVAPFTGINVSSGISVYLSMGNEHVVTIDAPEHILENIVTETKNGILKINFFHAPMKINRSMFEKIKVYVTATWLESIELSSGSVLHCEHTLKLEKLIVKSSSGADANINVESIDLLLYASSGADIKVKGTTLNLTAKATGGADIKGRELETINASLQASAGSDIAVKVSGELEASASTGADIIYYGDAFPKSIRKSTGGDVRKRN